MLLSRKFQEVYSPYFVYIGVYFNQPQKLTKIYTNPSDLGKYQRIMLMGGYGSTRWNYHRTKTTAGSCYQITVKNLKLSEVAGYTKAKGILSWNDGNSLGVYYHADSLLLLYAYTSAQGERKEISERVTISKAPLHLGGFQWFIHCPACQRRSRTLYRPSYATRYLCRDCHKLSYLSCQQSHQWDRGSFGTLGAMQETSQRIDKLRARLRRKRPGSIAHNRIWKRLSELYRVFQQQTAAAELRHTSLSAELDRKIAKLGLEDEWRKRKQS